MKPNVNLGIMQSVFYRIAAVLTGSIRMEQGRLTNHFNKDASVPDTQLVTISPVRLLRGIFSGFVCIDLNVIAGSNMRLREHLEFSEPV